MNGRSIVSFLLVCVVTTALCSRSSQGALVQCFDGTGGVEVESNACSCDEKCGLCSDVSLGIEGLGAGVVRNEDVPDVHGIVALIHDPPGSPAFRLSPERDPYRSIVGSPPIRTAGTSVVLLI